MNSFDMPLLLIVRNDMALLIDKHPDMSLGEVYKLAVKNSSEAQSHLKDKQ